MHLVRATRGSPIPPTLVLFFNDTATTEIYTLSLHDALPISREETWSRFPSLAKSRPSSLRKLWKHPPRLQPLGHEVHWRSEEHTSELQSTPISRMPSSA